MTDDQFMTYVNRMTDYQESMYRQLMAAKDVARLWKEAAFADGPLLKQFKQETAQKREAELDSDAEADRVRQEHQRVLDQFVVARREDAN